MSSADAALARYLAEWYTPGLSGRAITDVRRCLEKSLAAMPTGAQRPELLYAVQVPTDSYAFGVFVADSAEVVGQVCSEAGLPADRVTAAVEAAPGEAH